MIWGELNNLVHADMHGTFNTSVKTREQLKKTDILCGPFSKQQISLEHSLLKELESALVAWFKYVYTNNAYIWDASYTIQNMGPLHSLQILLPACQSTWYIPEDRNLYEHYSENLTFRGG